MADHTDPTKEHATRVVRKGRGSLKRAASLLRLALAAFLLFLAAWVIVPPVAFPALLLSVGAPEVGVWLILLALVVAAFATREARRSRVAKLTIVCAIVTIMVAVVPFLQFPATARRFDSAMRAGLGKDYLSEIDESDTRRLRRHPLDVRELLTGLEAGEPRVVRGARFAVNDGVPLTLDVYRPTSPGTYPGIVEVYGGGWQRGAPADNAAFDSYLATHGYVVFAIDYRHAPQWRWPAQQSDVGAALEWIARHGTEYDADPTRLAVMGRSSGAELAMVAAYARGGPPIRAVVSYYGPVDLIEGYRHPPRPDPLDVRQLLVAFLGGPPEDAPDAYRSASPIGYVDRALPPTLLVYGAHDHIVEARFGRMLQSRLLAAGSTSVYLEIPWAEHGFDVITGGPSGQLALFYTERFLAWALATNRASRPPS
jgi:acetyl esterase/lipase